MSERIECLGFCWMKKAGVVVWNCDQKNCPFWTFFFGRSGKVLDTCFT